MAHAKGDIQVGKNSNGVDIVPVGADTFILTADSAQTLGIKWAAGIPAAWTTYVPVLTASVSNPNLGTGGTSTGAFATFGKTIIGRAQATFGTGGSAGSGAYRLSLPATATSASGEFRMLGTATVYDGVTSTIPGAFYLDSGVSTYGQIYAGTIIVSAVAPFAFATPGSFVSVSFTYEGA